MPMIVHGLPVVGLQSIVPVGKTVPPPTLSQLSADPGKVMSPVAMVPVPGVTPIPAVGIVERTVLLLPATSHAKPKRGAKLYGSRLYGPLIPLPTCTRPTFGTKFAS